MKTRPFLIVLDAIFVSLYVTVALGLYHAGHLPNGIGVMDLILLGLASARLSDIISTDEIMQWLREPFVKLEPEEIAGHEVQSRTGKGTGFRKVTGDLLACPWCVGVWVAAGLTYLYFLAPRPAWLFILLLAVAEIGSLLQTLSTVLVRLEKYCKGLGVPEEGP